MALPRKLPRTHQKHPFWAPLGAPKWALGEPKGPQEVGGCWEEIREKIVPNKSPEGAPGPLPGPGWPGPARAGPAGPGAGQASLHGLGLGLAGRPRQGPRDTLWLPIWATFG